MNAYDVQNDVNFIQSQGYILSGWETATGGWYAVAHSPHHRPAAVAPSRAEAIRQLAAIIKTERESHAERVSAVGW